MCYKVHPMVFEDVDFELELVDEGQTEHAAEARDVLDRMHEVAKDAEIAALMCVCQWLLTELGVGLQRLTEVRASWKCSMVQEELKGTTHQVA